MAILIDLSDYDERRAPRAADKRSERSAEIVFFTGIRYERIEDEPRLVTRQRI